jgi:hypothetical protein
MNSFDLSPEAVSRTQASVCLERNVECAPTLGESIVGFAAATKGHLPINGLRHPAAGDTSGWYLWCGEELLNTPDFFQPMHARHIYEEYPKLIQLLGMPPGYRFLLAGEYLDIWYDEALLNV